MNRNIIMHCYYTVNKDLKDHKTLEEITKSLEELASNNQMSLLDLTLAALEAKRMNAPVNEEDMKEYDNAIKKIRRKLLTARRDEIKRSLPAKMVTNDEASSKEKERLYMYFDALLKAYNLEMPIEMGLIVVSEKLHLNIDDIKNNSQIYLEKYASGFEKNNYNQKLKRQARLAKNPTKPYVNNYIAHQLMQLLDKETGSRLGAKTAVLLANVTEFDLNSIKNIITKEYSFKLSEAQNDKERQYLFAKEEELISIINCVVEERSKNASLADKNSKSVRISKAKLDNLNRFLEANMTLKDFGNSDAFPKGTRGTASVRKYLESACGNDTNLKETLAKHIKTVEEYELSYLNTILDLILDYRRNGIGADQSKREFDILDYYCLTNYPLADLRNAVINYHLIPDCDLAYISPLVSKDDLHKNNYNKVSLESFLNDVTGYLIDGKMRYLTREEKEGIYSFFATYNIPATSYSIRAASYRYLNGTLFLPSKSLDKQLVRVKKD